MNKKRFLIGTVTGVGILLATIVPAFADSVSVNFENPPYTIGNINGQDGWTALGSAGSGCAVYDEGVNSSLGTTGFGSQSFRISNAVTSGCFGDQAFAKPLINAVGEADSTDGTFSPGTLQKHFEMQFAIASANPSAQQPGLAISVSPDRGDGSRMSYLRFEDGTDGIDVFFDDVQGTSNPANFVETEIGTGLDRTVPHTIKLTLDTLDGPSNDVVKVWIDGVLVHTGTSWENYYRYDSEASAEQSPRIVKTVLFRAGGTAVPTTNGKGFLFDNLTMSSGPIPPVLVGPPTYFAQCKNNGWKTFNNPSFKNEGLCIAYVATHLHRTDGSVGYTAYSLVRHGQWGIATDGSSAFGAVGAFAYTDANHDWYVVNAKDLNVSGNTAWFAGPVTSASQHAWVGQWLFAKVLDNSPDQISGSFTTQSAAETGVSSMTNPADGPFTVTSGNLTVH